MSGLLRESPQPARKFEQWRSLPMRKTGPQHDQPRGHAACRSGRVWPALGRDGGIAMLTKKDAKMARQGPRDPFALLRDMTSQFERMFDEGTWPTFRWPASFTKTITDELAFKPAIDVFEKNGRLVTKIDLPGMKKEDVKVEVGDGYLAISGERKSELEEKKDAFYRCEREYGHFYRAVPLPEGAKPEDVTATFNEGVLEVSVPVPAQTKAEARRVEIQTPGAAQAA
jgi:HSP20 family protein